MPIYVSRGRFTADAVKDLMAKREHGRPPITSPLIDSGIRYFNYRDVDKPILWFRPDFSAKDWHV
jgi:hypothetical protein